LNLGNAVNRLGRRSVGTGTARPILAEWRLFSKRAGRPVAAWALGFVAMISAVRTVDALALGGLAAMARVGVVAIICETIVPATSCTILGKP